MLLYFHNLVCCANHKGFDYVMCSAYCDCHIHQNKLENQYPQEVALYVKRVDKYHDAHTNP